VGLGGVYLNFKGREREGILEEGHEAERVRNAIQSGLREIPDVKTQRAAVRGVSRREDLYSGPYAANAPDLLVNFHPGFRVSWESAVGGFANSLIADNMRKWSGDHIVDPEAVPGVLFVNRQLAPGIARAGMPAPPKSGQGAPESERATPSIIDLAPTILNYLEVPLPQTMEGTPLL